MTVGLQNPVNDKSTCIGAVFVMAQPVRDSHENWTLRGVVRGEQDSHLDWRDTAFACNDRRPRQYLASDQDRVLVFDGKAAATNDRWIRDASCRCGPCVRRWRKWPSSPPPCDRVSVERETIN